jgi:hypothetical protein
MNHSRHLQTLSHVLHPSVAQKDENLTAPDQDYGGGGGAMGSTAHPNLAIATWVRRLAWGRALSCCINCTSIANWELYCQLPTCDAPIRTNNVIGALQNVWAGGCGSTPRPRSIMQLRFSTSWSLNSLNLAHNGTPIDYSTSIHSTQPFVNVPYTVFLCLKEFNYSSWSVTCVRHRRHFHRLLQRRYLSDDRVLYRFAQ